MAIKNLLFVIDEGESVILEQTCHFTSHAHHHDNYTSVV